MAGDTAAIHAITEAAFRDVPYSDGSEPDLVNQLRGAGDLALSLVADHGGQIVGHIAFHPSPYPIAQLAGSDLGRSACSLSGRGAASDPR